MKPQRKALLRLATRIHSHLPREQQVQTRIELPINQWHELLGQVCQINRARNHGWYLAATRLTEELSLRLATVRAEITSLNDRINSTPKPPLASIQDIYDDLAALCEEFPAVDWDLRHGTLSVTTEPIELEEIYLGPFEIRLDWRHLRDSDAYRVIAQDANPAACNSSVTHPHVQDEAVCEGDGRVPIRRALEQGRLLDFSLIVANLLRTYNSASPYVSLSDWHGVECSDCGTTAGDDDRYTCEKCEASVCSECYYSCPACDGIFCAECVERCITCDEVHCTGCTRSCNGCGDDMCPNCLDKSERCESCNEQAKNRNRVSSAAVVE